MAACVLAALSSLPPRCVLSCWLPNSQLWRHHCRGVHCRPTLLQHLHVQVAALQCRWPSSAGRPDSAAKGVQAPDQALQEWLGSSDGSAFTAGMDLQRGSVQNMPLNP